MFNIKVEVFEEIKNIDSCCIFKKVIPYYKDKQLKIPKKRIYCNSIGCRKNSAIPKFFAVWFQGKQTHDFEIVDEKDIKIILYCPICKKYFPVGIETYKRQSNDNVF